MTEEDPKLKVSYNAIEDAIREHLSNMEVDGIVTGWTLGVAITHFAEGDEYDGLFQTTSESLSKWTNIGILTAMLETAKDVTFSVDDDE